MRLEQTKDGQTVLGDDLCTFTYTRLRPGCLLVEIKGRDKGQFGTAAIDQLRDEIQRFGTLTLLIDASEGSVTGSGVTETWRDFFKGNRDALDRVTVLVGSPFMEFMVGATIHLGQLGRVVTITTDADAFNHTVDRERTAR